MIVMQQALVTRSGGIDRRFYEHLQRVSYRAKCFLFDYDASRLIGQFANECVDLVLDHRQFARPPYDVTYIEYDNKGLQSGIHGDWEGWEDVRTGFLVYLSTVYVFVSRNDAMQTPAMIWPVFYYCAERGSKVDHKSVFPVANYGPFKHITKLMMIAGSGIHHLVKIPPLREGDAEPFAEAADAAIIDAIKAGTPAGKLCEDLYNSNEIYFGGAKHLRNYQHSFLKESVGDLRKLWAGLLWLQSLPKTVTYVDVPAGASLVRGKRVAMSAHHTVHIHMRGAKTVRRQYLAAHHKRNSPRLHDVRGHHKHRGGMAIGCSHVWPPTPNEKGQFLCEKCQRKRWFVKAFKRGDESKGFVDKDYQLEI